MSTSIRIVKKGGPHYGDYVIEPTNMDGRPYQVVELYNFNPRSKELLDYHKVALNTCVIKLLKNNIDRDHYVDVVGYATPDELSGKKYPPINKTVASDRANAVVSYITNACNERKMMNVCEGRTAPNSEIGQELWRAVRIKIWRYGNPLNDLTDYQEQIQLQQNALDEARARKRQYEENDRKRQQENRDRLEKEKQHLEWSRQNEQLSLGLNRVAPSFNKSIRQHGKELKFRINIEDMQVLTPINPPIPVIGKIIGFGVTRCKFKITQIFIDDNGNKTFQSKFFVLYGPTGEISISPPLTLVFDPGGGCEFSIEMDETLNFTLDDFKGSQVSLLQFYTAQVGLYTTGDMWAIIEKLKSEFESLIGQEDKLSTWFRENIKPLTTMYIGFHADSFERVNGKRVTIKPEVIPIELGRNVNASIQGCYFCIGWLGNPEDNPVVRRSLPVINDRYVLRGLDPPPSYYTYEDSTKWGNHGVEDVEDVEDERDEGDE